MRILDSSNNLINQLLPHKNEWAWKLYVKACNNNWIPTQISMSRDIQQWKDKDFLTDDEKLVIKRCLGFFAGAESLVSNNLLMNIFSSVNDGECRQYISRQSYEETAHNWTIVYICDSLNLSIKEVYEAYNNIPAIKAKDDFLINNLVNKTSNYSEILDNIISYYIICEGIFFFSGFAMLLSFGRQQKIPGIAEQIQYTLRDETLHIEFGTKLINKIKSDYPNIWTKEYKDKIIRKILKAVDLEIEYAKDVLPKGILGLNSNMFIEYMQYIGNKRLLSIGLDYSFGKKKNPFPWLSEIIELEKNKNFFETHVNNYSIGKLVDDL